MNRGRVGALVDLLIWLTFLIGGTLLGSLFRHVAASPDLVASVTAPTLMLLMVVVATWLLRRRGERWRDVGLGRPVSVWRVMALVVGGMIGFLIVSAVVKLLVLPALHAAPPNVSALGGIAHRPWRYAWWLVLAWTSAAIGEELQFRGFALSRIERLVGAGPAAATVGVIGQAALFGLAHLYQGVGGVLLTGGIGLVLGVMVMAGRRNLIAGMILHGLTDTLSLTILFLGLVPTGG